MASSTSNIRFLYAIFTSDVCGRIGLIIPYYLKPYFGMGNHFGMGIVLSSKHLQTPFLKYFCAMASISSIEKDSVVTI